MDRRRGIGIFAVVGLVAALGTGCVHRREVYYPRRGAAVPAGRGVHVRAPFVDVQVPARDTLPEAEEFDVD